MELVSKKLTVLTVGLAMLTAILLVGIHACTAMATAAMPPTLVPAVLGGKPIQVLYMTRAGDTVLVRCYPGYEPSITLRVMGNKPEPTAPKEGVLTCKAIS
jgi:hypothetical protein